MRRKKHKSTRRTVRFFKIAFGFKEPFRVRLGPQRPTPGLIPSPYPAACCAHLDSTVSPAGSGAGGWELHSCLQHSVVRRRLPSGSSARGPAWAAAAPFPLPSDATGVCCVTSQGQAPLQEALTKFLGAPVKLFVSKCVTKELRELGEEMKGASTLTPDSAQQTPPLRPDRIGLPVCAHQTPAAWRGGCARGRTARIKAASGAPLSALQT